MCLYMKNSKIHIAKEDIICYKILVKERKSWIYRIFHKPTYRAPCHRFYTYKLKKLYDLGKSLHTCDDIYFFGVIYKTVNEGFHSFVDLQDAEHMLYEWYKALRGQTTIVQCVIPKGAEYIKGRTSLSRNSPESYVSHQIICVKEV